MQYVAPAVSPNSTLSQSRRQPKFWAIVGSLLLLGISYLLLTAAPAVSQQLRGIVGSGGRGGALALWALMLAAVGLLVGGGAVLMFVLVQLAGDVRRRPYAYLAPALATFSACVLVGLDARLPLTGISAEHVAVFALVVSVVGGALMQDTRAPLQFTGLLLTLWPPVCLMLMVWTAGMGRLSPAALGYLSILTVSSLAIAALALVVRTSEAAERRTLGLDRTEVAQVSGDARALEEVLSGAFSTAASTLRQGIVRLHRPLLAAFGIALAVGVVRAIVGASAQPEALEPARMEPVHGPVVSPLGEPSVEPEISPTVTAAHEPEPVVSRSRAEEPRAAAAVVAPISEPSARAVSKAKPSRSERAERARVRAERRRIRVSTRTVKGPAVAPSVVPQVKEEAAPDGNIIIDASAWGAEEVARAPAPRARTVQKPIAAVTPTRQPMRSEPESVPAPKPAARESADPGLDALIKDVLTSTK